MSMSAHTVWTQCLTGCVVESCKIACLCRTVRGRMRPIGTKLAPAAAVSRFRRAHPPRRAADIQRRGMNMRSPQTTSGWRSTSPPGRRPQATSGVPSPPRAGSAPGSTGSWAERCPPPSRVWCPPRMSRRTERWRRRKKTALKTGGLFHQLPIHGVLVLGQISVLFFWEEPNCWVIWTIC